MKPENTTGVPPTGRIEELLREADWVRALARRLVANEAEAEDVVQDAWVAALRRPPRAETPARAWLAAVVRNAAASRARRRSNERAREEAVHEAERVTPAPDEDLRKLETQEQLLRLVRGLDEGERQVVQLTCLEGWTSARVGRELGIAEGTVRWRLKRALERLRGRLDAEYGGDRSAWMAALAPLALRREGVVGTTGLSAAGVVLGVAKGVAAAAALVALGFGLRALVPAAGSAVSGSEPGRASVETVVADTTAEDASESELDPTATRTSTGSRSEDESIAAAADDVTRVSGRIVDRDGLPVADADVSATADATLAAAIAPALDALGPLQRMRALAGLRARTGSDGAFALESRLVSETGGVLVTVEGPRFESLTLQVEVNPGESSDLGDVVLEPGGAVRGVVRDSGGDPLRTWLTLEALPDGVRSPAPAEERIGAPAPPFVSGRDGAFDRRGLEPGFYRAWIGSRDSQRWTPSEVIEVVAGVAVELALVEAARAPLVPPSLLVLDAEGAPLARAAVSVAWDGYESTGSTDAGGRYDCASAAGRTTRIRIRDTSFAHAVGERTIERFQGELTVQLEALAYETRILRVVAGDGRAIEDAEVVQRLDEWTRPLPRGGPTHELRFPDGRATALEVRAPGFRTLDREGVGPQEGGGELTLVLERLPLVRGRVTADGEPVVQAEVRLVARMKDTQLAWTGERLSRYAWWAGRTTETGPDGWYELTAPERGTWALRVRSEGHADEVVELGPFEALGDVGASLPVDVRLRAPGRVVGVARDADGRPLAGLRVIAARAEHEGKVVRTRRDGGYELRGLAPGSWSVRLMDPKLRRTGNTWATVEPDWTFPSDCVVVSGETTTLDLRPPGAPELRLSVAARDLSTYTCEARRVRGADPFAWRQSVEATGDGRSPAILDLPADARFTLALESPALDVELAHTVSLEARDRAIELGVRAAALELAYAPTPETDLIELKGTVDGWTWSRTLQVGRGERPARLNLPAGTVEVTAWNAADETLREDTLELGKEGGRLDLP